MEYFKPEYFDSFRCIAAACPDSSCKEWEVDIDPETAAYYRTLTGPLGERLRQVLRTTEDGTVMVIENGRCPMWRQDGLCRIQAELGHDALSAVCREFPRLRHDYGDFVELGLELSCPEAARLILSSPIRAKIVTRAPGGDVPEYDTDVMAILRRSRDEFLIFLSSNAYSVPETLAVLLLYGHAVQSELDGGVQAVLDPEQTLQDAHKWAKSGDADAIFAFFRQLEILTPQWKTRLQQVPVYAPWTDTFRNLAGYFIDRYWLQAVSDYDLISRVKLTVVACLLIHALGGDTIETAQLFSKEIENDPDNVDAILDAAYTESAFTDVRILGLLLQ